MKSFLQVWGKKWHKPMERFHFFTLLSCFFVLASLKSSYAVYTITRNQSLRDGETLSSATGKFELGFFSPGSSSKNSYLGIWLKQSRGTVLWVANREIPLTSRHGVLSIRHDGNLVLLDQAQQNIVWSTNVSSIVGDPVVHLLDSGNLVLMDSSADFSTESYEWQSFDHPSDTLLPGMKVGWNLTNRQERYLTSWSSPDDPSPGNLTYRLSLHGLPTLYVAEGPVKKFRFGPWNGLAMGIVPYLPNFIVKASVVRTADELYFTIESLNASNFVKSSLNQSSWIRYVIYGQDSEWTPLIWTPMDVCDNYGHCGANAICTANTAPTCECLKGFAPKTQELNLQNWLDQRDCRRASDLNCQTETGFVKVAGVTLPDLLEIEVIQSMTLEGCRIECLRNCSCQAYANWNATSGGTGCLMWFGDLIDVRFHEAMVHGQDLYLRVPASELERLPDSNSKKRLKTILIPTMSGTTIILGLVFCICSNKRKGKAKESGMEEEGIHMFDLETIAVATDNFSDANKIGEGGFGSVYKGKLLTGQEIAVKKLSKNSRQGDEEFRNEVVLISKLQHKNLVALIGSCTQGEDRMLIYEYLPNKSLDYFIFDLERSTLLAWRTRYSIVLGIARGLLYLHEDSKFQVVHRDLKPSNILLDSNLNPKISDFGLARIFGDDGEETQTNRVVGTYGYISPEYANDGTFSIKSDVFSFGVLLLEIVSGKRNRGFSHPDHHHNLLGHVWLLWREHRSWELTDSSMADSCFESQVMRCVHVGLLCVQSLPQDIPTMSSAVFMLSNEGASLPQPKQPGFFADKSSIVDGTTEEEAIYTKNTITITMFEGR